MTGKPARGKKWLAGVLAVLTAAVALGISLHQSAPSEVPMLDGASKPVAPGISILQELGPAAAYVVETSDGLILIDSGLESDAQPLKSQMGKLGLDWRKVRAIFLTHVHGDHCGGAEHLRTTAGAKVYAGAADVPFLQAGGPREAFFSTFHMPHHAPHRTTVDVALKGTESIAVGDVVVQVLGTPGHTPGSTCYLVERGGRRVLFSGDVINSLGDVPLGIYSAYLAPRYRGDARSFLASLRMLRGLKVPDILLPGHPTSPGVPRSPQLSRERWEAMLDEGIHDMDRLLARYTSDGESFLDGNPKRLLPDLYYLGDFQNQAVYAFFTGSKLFVVDAPGGEGFVAFLKERQQQLGLPPTDPTAVLLTACGERETAGLGELLESTSATVVAGSAGLDALRKRHPTGTKFVAAADLAEKGWFSVTPLELRGRGIAPVAYLVPWEGKKVLFSGRIPAEIDQQSREELMSELSASKVYPQSYADSLKRLVDVQPHLWLPAAPLNGQNANVYDRSWPNTLEKNYWTALQVMQGR